VSQNILGFLLNRWRCPHWASKDMKRRELIGTMDETRSARVTRADVRAALMWALELDRVALLAHRAAVHSSKSDLTRRRADKVLVEQWRAQRPDGGKGTSAGD
jgi:hypothetical protein